MVSAAKKKRSPARKKKGRKPVRRRRRSRRQSTAGGRYARHIADAGVFCLTVAIGLAVTFAFVASDLPDTGALWRDGGGPKITLLAVDGAPIAVNGASAGTPMRLADVPSYVPDAILAVEDRNFHHHFGVNPVAIGRAALVNLREGQIVQGGSTITQQLAKNIFLTSERTVKRKAQEFLLALWLEHKFSKDEILTLYMNRVYFGAGAYGIDAASYRYFGKSARRLTLGEAAILAGLLKAPSRFAPTVNPGDAGRRGRLVINQMVSAGFISELDASAVVEQPILLSGDRHAASPYFADYVMAEVERLIGRTDADIIVRTTFERHYQDAAETGLAAGLAIAGADLNGAQAALVMIDGSGAVRAMIGGRDYSASQFNRAVQARRQPGSAFKPFVFLAAAETGAGASRRIEDTPLRIGSWRPKNYNDRYYGEVTYREALALSLNSATLRVQEQTGRDTVHEIAKAAGWPSLSSGPAVGLGVDVVSPLRLAGAYAVFANGGFRVAPYAIESIETIDGEVLYKRDIYFEDQIARSSSIDAVNEMMSSVVDWGTGKSAQLPGYRVAGKTGTTQNNRDAWFAGHTDGIITVVWLGRDDNGPMRGVTGGGAPGHIWREVMLRALPPRYVAPLQTQ
ncbi:MAG: PBP1A family penicillin-binding protein [Pseudomonadota bacterium]